MASTHADEHLRSAIVFNPNPTPNPNSNPNPNPSPSQAPLVSAIVFNQLFGPPALKYALRAARENG